MKKETTLVIFRKWRAQPQDVIALFPFEPADYDGYTCNAYGHFGGHGGATPGLMRKFTIPATPEEYADLKSELEKMGYVLKIGKRFPKNSIEIRRKKIKEMK